MDPVPIPKLVRDREDHPDDRRRLCVTTFLRLGLDDRHNAPESLLKVFRLLRSFKLETVDDGEKNGGCWHGGLTMALDVRPDRA